MAADTKIEWADHTFNPWEGCQKVGPGCDHCYAETRNARFAGGQAINWGPGAPRRRTSAKNWYMPFQWNDQAKAFMAQHGRRQRVFCASLADVFDNEVPPEWRHDLFNLISATPHLDWLLLTKRPQNIVRMVQDHGCVAGNGTRYLPGNVWLGATAEDQHRADINVPALIMAKKLTGAAKTFLSVEPLLGPVELGLQCENWSDDIVMDPETGAYECCKACDYTGVGNDIDWVIVSGESGPGARPMHPDWARSLRDQCQAAGVPFLFKQWGGWKPISQMDESEHGPLYKSRVVAKSHEDQGNLDDIHGRTCTVPFTVVHLDGSTHGITEPMAFLQGTGAMQTFKVGKKAAGRLLDGRTWDEVPR